MTRATDCTGSCPQQSPKKARPTLLRQLTALLTALPFMATAATTVTVTVTVVAPPPCVINDDQPISVDFGEVMTTKVDGKNYKMPVNYTLSCTDASSNAMTLAIAGTGTGFDGNALLTNKTGLGIKLLNGGSKYMLNVLIPFTYPNKPDLYAVPIQQSGVILTGGEFSAAATMHVAYQ